MMLPFCGHFYWISHQQWNSNKLKDFKTLWHLNWNIWTYYSRIPKDEKNCTLKPQFELHDEKYVQGTQKFVQFRWFFELWEFELKEFSCKDFLVNSEGTKEFVRFRWFFKLQEFELHELNCSKCKFVGRKCNLTQ